MEVEKQVNNIYLPLMLYQSKASKEVNSFGQFSELNYDIFCSFFLI